MESWRLHLNTCEQCRKAIRGRFAGISMMLMAEKCCFVGKPLYLTFIHDENKKEGNQ